MLFPQLEPKYRVFLVCVVGVFITVFDTSSSIVALPTIAHEFATDLPTAQWVIIGNGVTIAALLVPVGRLSDLIGRKPIYVVGALLFAIGALLAALAESIFGLIGARVFVGIGSAMTQGTAMAILVGHFVAAERAKMLGLQLGAVGLGAIAGPATGGLVVGTLGWRVLFALTSAAMLAIAIAGQRTLQRRSHRPRPEESFDYAGAVLFSTFLIALLLSLSLAPSFGWTSAPTLLGLGGAALLFAALVVVERRHPAPMLDFALFRNPDFGFGSLSAVVTFMGISATRFLTPFFLQGVKGLTPSQVGLLIVPAALVTTIAAPFAGRFADRWGVRTLANIGMAVSVAGFAMFVLLDTTTATITVVTALMVSSLGMAFFGAANSAAILNSVEASTHGVASGFVNLCRNSGNVIGVAFGTVIVSLTMAAAGYPATLAAVEPEADPDILHAFTRGFGIAAAALVVLAGAVLAIVVGWSWRARRA